MTHLRFLSRRGCRDRRAFTATRRGAMAWIAGLALALVLGALSWRSPGAQASGPTIQTPLQPFGLIAMEQYSGCEFAKTPPSCPTASLFANAATNPAIAGLMLRVPWRDMQPTSGDSSATNWAITDAAFTQAEASTSLSQPRGADGPTAHKFVVLAFVPGFDTPPWALTGVQTAQFCTPYGVGAGTTKTLPMPWDATYQSEWSAFLQQVASHYAGKQDLLMVAAAGPTSVSDEMSLPGAEDSAKSKCSTAQIKCDIDTWEGKISGTCPPQTLPAPPYTPTAYESAWTAAFGQYASSFPSQYTSLSLYPGLSIPDKSQLKATPESVINAGAATFGTKFALQANGLAYASGGPKDTMYQLVSENSGKMVTGFQLIDSATNPAHWSTEGGPSAATAAQALQNALDAGLTSKAGAPTNVDFLEIYEDDVDAARTEACVQAVLQSTALRLPLPQPLTDSPPSSPTTQPPCPVTPRPSCPPATGDERTCT